MKSKIGQRIFQVFKWPDEKNLFFSQRIANYKSFWSRNFKKFSKKIYYGNHNFNIKKWQLFSNFSVFLVTRWEKLFFSERIRNFNVWLFGNIRKFCKKIFCGNHKLKFWSQKFVKTYFDFSVDQIWKMNYFLKESETTSFSDLETWKSFVKKLLWQPQF